jgi:fructosamine-3-kinase
LWPDSGANATDPTGPGLLVLEYLEPDGDEPTAATWEALGRGLAELHRAPEDRFGWSRDNYCGLTLQENGWADDWPEFFARRRLGTLVERLQSKGALSPAERKTYTALVEKTPSLLAHSPRPSLIHGDLWSGNFLSTALGPALVDPAAYCADREAEWAMMLLFGGFPDRVLAAYQEAWPLPPEWRERIPLYQLYHVLNHQLLFGGSYGGQAIRLARKFV